MVLKSLKYQQKNIDWTNLGAFLRYTSNIWIRRWVATGDVLLLMLLIGIWVIGWGGTLWLCIRNGRRYWWGGKFGIFVICIESVFCFFFYFFFCFCDDLLSPISKMKRKQRRWSDSVLIMMNFFFFFKKTYKTKLQEWLHEYTYDVISVLSDVCSEWKVAAFWRFLSSTGRFLNTKKNTMFKTQADAHKWAAVLSCIFGWPRLNKLTKKMAFKIHANSYRGE